MYFINLIVYLNYFFYYRDYKIIYYSFQHQYGLASIIFYSSYINFVSQSTKISFIFYNLNLFWIRRRYIWDILPLLSLKYVINNIVLDKVVLSWFSLKFFTRSTTFLHNYWINICYTVYMQSIFLLNYYYYYIWIQSFTKIDKYITQFILYRLQNYNLINNIAKINYYNILFLVYLLRIRKVNIFLNLVLKLLFKLKWWQVWRILMFLHLLLNLIVLYFFAVYNIVGYQIILKGRSNLRRNNRKQKWVISDNKHGMHSILYFKNGAKQLTLAVGQLNISYIIKYG